jgi:hypothetical protein
LLADLELRAFAYRYHYYYGSYADYDAEHGQQGADAVAEDAFAGGFY